VCLALAAFFCVATPVIPPPPRPFAAWTLEPGAAQAGTLGRATARAWVSKSGKRLGPIYLEGQIFRGAFGAGAGWAIDPRTADHGPELFG
jgi:hypothetical protein